MKTLIILLLGFALALTVSVQGQDTLSFDIDEIQWTSPGTGVPVRVQNFENIIAFQFSIEWDTAALRLDSVGGFSLDGLTDNTFFIDEPYLNVAWDDATLNGISMDDDTPIFSLFFTPLEEALDTNDVVFSPVPTPPVAVSFFNNDVEEFSPDFSDGYLQFIQPLVLIEAELSPSLACAEDSDGFITVEMTGGLLPYTYYWNGVEGPNSLTDLPAGVYDLLVVDALGNSIQMSYEIEAPAPIEVDFLVVEPLCADETSGSIDVQVSGGTPAYTFSWSNGASAEDIEMLPAGTYTLEIEDDNGCGESLAFQLTEPEPVMVFPEATEMTSCWGGNDGSIALDADGGNGEYTFYYAETTTPLEPPVLENLSAGTYFFYAIDGNGCESSLTQVEVTEPVMIEVMAETTDVACGGEESGAIELSITGGVGAFDIQWSNGESGPFIEGLVGGEYEATVTDENACTLSSAFLVAEPPQLEVTPTLVSPNCNNTELGSISVLIEGGMGDYLLNWSNGATGMEITDLLAGNYELTVSDENGCELLASYLLEPPTAIEPDILINYGCGEGTIGLNAFVIQGLPPYEYEWSTGDTTKQILGLFGGVYSVMVTDSEGCTGMTTAEVEAVPFLDIDGFRTNISCNGANDGSIDLTVTGSLPPYSYSWSNGETSEDLSNLPSGEYTVSISSSSGCNFSQSFQINEPPPLMNTVLSEEQLNGTWIVQSIPSGGVPPYEISWSTGATGSTVENLPMGSYEVQITDSNGCVYTEVIPLGISADQEQHPTIHWSLSPNPTDGLIYISMEGQVHLPALLNVIDPQGRRISQVRMLQQPFALDLSHLPGGIYYVQLQTEIGVVAQKVVLY